MGPVITFFFCFDMRWLVKKPKKNPNNALDFGLRASIFEVIIFFLTYVDERESTRLSIWLRLLPIAAAHTNQERKITAPKS